MYGILLTMLGKNFHQLIGTMHGKYLNTAVDYKFPVNQTAKATGKSLKFQYSWLRMCILGLPFLRRRMTLIAKLVCFFENTVRVSSDCNSSKVYRLVTKPLQLWSSAASMLKEHDTQSEVHKTALLKSSEFLKYHNSDVLQQLNSTWMAQIAENRQKLKSIVKCIIFCGKQGIALRGHVEYGSLNSGNFLELLNFRAEVSDKVLQKHLQSVPHNATYKSASIQNELISIIGEWIQKKIILYLQQCPGVFSILAD